MNYPKLRALESSRQIVDTFKGYNHNLRIGDGEFFDMKNMTSDHYPVLSPRNGRGVYASATNPNGMIAKDSLCYVDGTKFVINEYPVDMGLNDEPKQLISMGAYVIIMPDKKWINTLDTTQFGNIEAIWESIGDVTFTLCTITGDAYDGAAASATEPKEPKNMQLWIDTSSTPHALKQYSETSSAWISIASTYIKIAATGIGKAFEQYDGVTISGVTAAGLQQLNSSTVIWDKGDDYIVVVGLLDEVTTQTAAQGVITVSRTMPLMDYITESDNRLWGCRYGMAANGQVVNEIYACKLGDFKNWNCFMGISTDSYAVGVGSDGPFTGAVTHLGYPLFFKENIMHKVYGKYPANFQIQDTACRGVQKDCERSMAIVNETLFYKARSGIMAYDGSLPTEVSYFLGNEAYSAAVGGAHGNKYYVSMADISGKYHLFVYDMGKGMWHKEDNLHVTDFCSCRGEMYAIDADTKKILTMLGSGDQEEKKLSWMVETGEIGISSPDMKYISRLTVRMLLDIGSEVRIYGKYDFSDAWEHLFVTKGTSLRSFSVPVRPKRCDHMRLRIEGEGMAKLYSITKTIEQGSEIS
jgi:hypothetical protein